MAESAAFGSVFRAQSRNFPVIFPVTREFQSRTRRSRNALLTTATALLAIMPPVAVVVSMQRWFVRGLVESEK